MQKAIKGAVTDLDRAAAARPQNPTWRRVGLTGWLPASRPPVRPGYYEVRGPMIDPGTLMHWNGRYWGDWHSYPFGPGHHYIDHGFGTAKGDAWRGLAHPGGRRARQGR